MEQGTGEVKGQFRRRGHTAFPLKRSSQPWPLPAWSAQSLLAPGSTGTWPEATPAAETAPPTGRRRGRRRRWEGRRAEGKGRREAGDGAVQQEAARLRSPLADRADWYSRPRPAGRADADPYRTWAWTDQAGARWSEAPALRTLRHTPQARATGQTQPLRLKRHCQQGNRWSRRAPRSKGQSQAQGEGRAHPRRCRTRRPARKWCQGWAGVRRGWRRTEKMGTWRETAWVHEHDRMQRKRNMHRTQGGMRRKRERERETQH